MDDRKPKTLTRRVLLRAGGAGIVVTAISGCEASSTDPADQDQDDGPSPTGNANPTDYNESPMLAERVQAGELPPLAERLPKQPFVVRPGVLVDDDVLDMQPGKFGGTLQLPQDSPDSSTTIWTGEREPLLWAPNGFDFDGGIEGNVVAGWEANADDTVFTFLMREGLRWSDGEPVTVEDVRFAFEDVLFDEQITPVVPSYLRPGERADMPPAELQLVDDLTFSLTFAEPYGIFPGQLAMTGWRVYWDLLKPFHYLKQFHEKYASAEELSELLREESLSEDEWFNLFNAKQMTGSASVSNPEKLGHPTLTPWVMTQQTAGVFTFERNPYYFKVDVDGNQLPYMDGLRSQLVADRETLTTRALFGEFDYLGERATFRQLPLMADKAEEGDVKLLIPRQHVLPTTIFLNLTHPDEVWREVVRDVRFRRALSLALNYEEIVDNFYLGEFASVPRISNPGVHNPEEAERLLDEMGLDARDDAGYRLGPDGSRFTVPFEVADLTENHVPVGELVAEYWNGVGVHTTVRSVDSTLERERAVANELKGVIRWLHFPLWASAAGFADYLPLNNWGPLWQLWYTSQGEQGEEPPDEIKELFELHGELMSSTVASPESKAAHDAIVQSHYDNLWNLQVVEDAYLPTFFTTRVKNVPEGKHDVFGIVASYSMEQWYLDE